MLGREEYIPDYPRLEIDLKKIYENTKYIVELCKSQGISVAGVVKGFSALPLVVEQFVNAGCSYIADSRIVELAALRNHGISLPLMLIRIPMLSEVRSVVKYADISLSSEREVLDAIERECQLQSQKHKVILMYDLGDLREGVFDRQEFIELALYVEKCLKYVELHGIGTNLGCYGSIKPTDINLGELCAVAKEIEGKINRRLDIISGGATSSLPLIIDSKIPECINNLRIGEVILLARDLNDFWGYDLGMMHKDTFVLKAEAIEIKAKPSYPIGEIFIDAFGYIPSYEDLGIRKRAILAAGKKDFGLHDKLIPQLDGIKIIGSSSDHLIIDIEDCKEDIKIGDILSFEMYYVPMLYLCASPDIKKVYIYE